VDNIPKYLSRVLRDIYQQLIVLLGNTSDEILDITEGCIKILVTKFSDKFFMEMLPMIKDTIADSKDNETILYASFYFIQIACSEASEKLLGGFKEKMLKLVNDSIHTQFSSIRRLLAGIIIEIARKFDEYNTYKTFIFNTMKLARSVSKDQKRNLLEIIGNLVEMKGNVLNLVKGEIFRKPYDEEFLGLATMIASDIAENIRDPVELKDLYAQFSESIQHAPKTSTEAITAITQNLDEQFLPIFMEFLDKLKIKIENGTAKGEGIDLHFSQMLFNYLQYTAQDMTKVMRHYFDITISLLILDNDEIVVNIGNTMRLLIEKSEDKSIVDEFLDVFLRRVSEIQQYFTHVNLELKFKQIMDSLLFMFQTGLLSGENKVQSALFIQTILEHSSRATVKSSMMKLSGPMIRVLSEKSSPVELKEAINDNIKALILKSKEDVKGVAVALQAVLLKTLTDSSVTTETLQLKAGENVMRLLQYSPRVDATVNDIFKSIMSKIEKNEGMLCSIEVEMLADIVRFYSHSLKPNVIKEQYEKIVGICNNSNEIIHELFINLLTSYTKVFTVDECTKLVSETKLNQLQSLFDFITIFNGNLDYFKKRKGEALKLIKQLPKTDSIILLKWLGKIVHKYKYFFDFNEPVLTELLANYENVIEAILSDSTILSPSSNLILDANMCVFLISLGYLNIYNDSELRIDIIRFILVLIEQGRVNHQLLANCLSLLTLKEVRRSFIREDILKELENLEIDDETVEKFENFLKKVEYLYH
jgi:hypothetical protein